MDRPPLKTVVVTGASSGIGRATALALDRAGFRVFAGVRTREAAESLRREASSRLAALRLDVTDADEVAAAAEEVRSAAGPEPELAALVSNAGIVSAVGPLEFIGTEAVRRQLEVNLIGHLTVVKAFLPLLRMSRGRIVVIGSGNGRMPLPLLGPYDAAEHALEAVCDVLRAELRPWRIRVSLIEPSLTRTALWEKGERATIKPDDMEPPDVRDIYARMIEKGWGLMRRMYRRSAAPPERIAAAVLKVLKSRRPKARYAVGPFSRLFRFFPLLPKRVLDYFNDIVLR
jgi:NAD(P)-dependent dehydrogenase (short-subunit alcohol dehydrogenase family)